MALGSLNLKVSQADFEKRIQIIELRMQVLADVVSRYQVAKQNLDQFIESSDNNYETMCANIDEYINNAKRAHAALNETKLQLLETVNQMEGMSGKVKETMTAATEAAKESLTTAIQVASIL